MANSKLTRPLFGLIVGQVFLHACMTGIRMAVPLQALAQGHSAWAVGVLLSLFAVASIVLALAAGRLADRRGFHVLMHVAVGMAIVGGMAATVSGHYLAMCAAALLVGTGATFGMIAIQRTAGHMAQDSVGRVRIFSWLGLAPALSNVIGPLIAGVLIDAAGFRTAFAALMVLPLATLLAGRLVPPEAPRPVASIVTRRHSWDLLTSPQLRRLLLVNWLISASWDVHTFVVPIIGHDRGMSASTIGAVLGSFAIAVVAVRLVIPVIAHRLSATQVLVAAMLLTGTIFGLYPLARTGWTMAACAIGLGLTLGAVTPMILSTLHLITPYERHGEAIAFRSMTISLSSSFMPLLFGLVGTALGAGALFWVMSTVVVAGSWPARRIEVGEARPG